MQTNRHERISLLLLRIAHKKVLSASNLLLVMNFNWKSNIKWKFMFCHCVAGFSDSNGLCCRWICDFWLTERRHMKLFIKHKECIAKYRSKQMIAETRAVSMRWNHKTQPVKCIKKNLWAGGEISYETATRRVFRLWKSAGNV